MKDWTKAILKESDSFENAIKVLNDAALRIALVVDDDNTLLGTITDGDIRRALLQHIPMSKSVKHIMNHNPISASKNDSTETILSKILNKDLLHAPITDKNNKLIGLKTLQDLSYKKRYDNPIFLMAGGLGSRLYPLTKDTPKPLLNIGGKPILESIIGRFINAGFHNFYISTYYKAEKIHKFFGNGSSWGVNIEYVNEVKPLGTAGSIGMLPNNLPNLPIIMMNGDVLSKLSFEDLLNFHNKEKALVTMCIREYDIQIPFGVVDIEGHLVQDIIEKPFKKFFVNAGIYVFEPELISLLKEGEYIDMPTLLKNQIKLGSNIAAFPIHEYWQDIGHIQEYESAYKSFSKGFF